MPRYDLRQLSSDDLLSELEALVARDRRLTAEVIAHIAEVDARGLFLKSACASMFSYCVSRLHMSESRSYVRIAAARAARRYPEIYDYLTSGELHLTSVKLLAPRLTPENHLELLESSKNLSRRGVERLIASRFPKPDVPTSLRKLPEKRPPGNDPGAPPPPAAETASSAPPSSPLPADVASAQGQLPQPVTMPRAEVRPLSEARYSLKLTISSGTHAKLLEAQTLMRHRIPGGELDTVLDRALDALLRELKHDKFGETDRPRKMRKPPGEGSRRVPNAVKREVAERDEHRCSFVDDQGRRCEERAFLEFDHIRPVARGGSAETADTVRLLCRAHNRHAAEEAFGKAFVNRKIAEAKRRRAVDRLAPGRAPPKRARESAKPEAPQLAPERVAAEPAGRARRRKARSR